MSGLRPNCRTPGACVAKGPRHCRRCSAAANLAAVNADPVRRAEVMALSAQAVSDPAHRVKLSDKQKQRMADPARRASISAAMKRVWADPDYAAKAALTRTTQAYRERQRASARGAWKDPEVTERRLAAIRRRLADPKVRAKIAASIRETMADPSVRERYVRASKLTQARPEVRAKIAATRASKAERRARAKAIVIAAGVAPWKRTVDRAVQLLAAGAPPAAVIATLRIALPSVAAPEHRAT